MQAIVLENNTLSSGRSTTAMQPLGEQPEMGGCEKSSDQSIPNNLFSPPNPRALEGQNRYHLTLW